MIYFIQGANGLIKIGTTTNVKTRMVGLGNHRHLKSPLTLLATMPGSYAEEFSIHEKFDHLRIQTGWNPEIFHPAPDLMEFIEYVQTRHPLEEEVKKPRDPQDPKERVAIEIDSTLHRKLRIARADTNETVGQIVSEALERYFADGIGTTTINVTIYIYETK